VAIVDAAKNLLSGNLVAFPTETVYGLGADACNKEAVAKIYAAKGRPVDHPLIVHVASMDALGDWNKKVMTYEQIHFPMPVTHDLPTLLHAYMKENGLTKKAFAALMEVGASTLSEILNKKRPVTLEFAKKLHTKINFDGNIILELV
jgi:tRNA A37 threonylcarbamoyladenosine synthetase subunit TsaC/SUA5/YrdC